MTTDRTVPVIVKRVHPFGVFVQLEDGREGYIRRRELSWDGDVEPQNVVAEGDRIKAVVVKPASPGKLMELSLKRTLPDPWEIFLRQHHEGEIVSGTVKSLMPFGVFVEVAPGVQGLVPLRELAPWEVKAPEEVVWIGDDVEAVITRLEPGERRLSLSIRAWIRQLDEQLVAAHLRQSHAAPISVAEQLALSPEEILRGLEGETAAGEAVSPQELRQVGQVLVVDDDKTVRQQLAGWLCRQGCPANAVGTPAAAWKRIHQHDYRLLIIDIDLPPGDGLALARQIKAEQNNIHIVVMSAADLIEKRIAEIEQLGVMGVLVKPLDLEEIHHLLARIARGEPPARLTTQAHIAAEPRGATAFRDWLAAMRTDASLEGQLRAGLERLREVAQAEAGIIFRMDPLSGTISIVAQVGTLAPAEEKLYALKDSPVRDVIREGERVLEENAPQSADKFRKLLEALPFESCVGVPIEAGGETHHALFLFHRDPSRFSQYRLRDALAAANLFGAAIERDALEERARALNQLLVAGQLAAGMGHEIYNKISGLELSLRNLLSDYQQLGHRNPQLGDSREYREIARAQEALLELAMDMKRTVGLFQQLMRADTVQELDVNQVVESAVTSLQPTARRLGVRIETGLMPNLPRTAGSAVQLRQVFLNVMLNAAQQMDLKPESSKVLRITTACQVPGTPRPILVRFSDAGPGIHKQLWDKIFVLGFSTRPGGTGLGLFIARTLVESLGGAIAVERSVVPIGTTFRVELPAVRMEVGR